MWVTPLQMSWQTWGHVRKRNIVGREFSRWVTGRNLSSKKRCRVCKGKEHRVNRFAAFSGREPSISQESVLSYRCRLVDESDCTVGRKMGFCKNRKSYLEPHNDTMVEMRRLCLERRREKGPCETEDSLHRTAQSTTKR